MRPGLLDRRYHRHLHIAGHADFDRIEGNFRHLHGSLRDFLGVRVLEGA